jgi:hypothetical protein
MNLMHLNKIKYNLIEFDDFYHMTSYVKNHEYNFDIFV